MRLSVRNNIAVSERYQYGRIGEIQRYTNDDREVPSILPKSFESFSCQNRGSGNSSVWDHQSDVRKIELSRKEFVEKLYPEKVPASNSTE